MTATAAIVVNDLSKAYGAHQAVRGLTFSVGRGEVFGLLGPNGAGKTTTVEILEGHRRRDGGEVSVLGFDPAGRAAGLRSRVGIVLQSCGTYPHLTVRETLEHFAAMYPAPRGVEETIALAGLEAAADRRARTLSGGQARRLDLALALVGDPELIFLDEPTTGFDPAARRAAWQVVRRAAGSKPVVGSSRKISSGSPTSASARSRRRAWPPDSVRARRSAAASRPARAIVSSTPRGAGYMAAKCSSVSRTVRCG